MLRENRIVTQTVWHSALGETSLPNLPNGTIVKHISVLHEFFCLSKTIYFIWHFKHLFESVLIKSFFKWFLKVTLLKFQKGYLFKWLQGTRNSISICSHILQPYLIWYIQWYYLIGDNFKITESFWCQTYRFCVSFATICHSSTL